MVSPGKIFPDPFPGVKKSAFIRGDLPLDRASGGLIYWIYGPGLPADPGKPRKERQGHKSGGGPGPVSKSRGMKGSINGNQLEEVQTPEAESGTQSKVSLGTLA